MLPDVPKKEGTMRSFRYGSRFLAGVVVAVLVIGASSAFGCAICKSSPDGAFGFCRWGYDRGWSDCTQSVKNPFTGATTCDLSDSACGTYAGGGWGDDYQDCAWTDLYGNCIQAY